MIFVTASIAFRFSQMSVSRTSVRLTDGIIIGFLLCINPRSRYQFFPTILALTIFNNHRFGQTWVGATGFGLTKTLEITIAIFPFRRLAVQRIDLTNIRTLLNLGFYGSIVGCSAAVLTLCPWMIYVARHPLTLDYLIASYCSNALSLVVVIPLYWSYRRKPSLERTPIFPFDAQLAFLLFTIVVSAVFWQISYPFLFLVFPVLIPVIYTSAFLGAARAILVTTIISVVATAYGHGPLMLIHTSPEGRVLILQFYLAVVLVTAFPFAALLTEREKLVRTLKQSEARYRDLARLDGLTQLPNRREFDSFLDISRQRSVRQGTALSLLLIDIDHFKKLNDQHGHTVGDEYLRKVAAAVASAVPRKTDLVARYGGEEFAVVLDSCDTPGAMMVAERIKSAVAKLSASLVLCQRPPVTVSIGVATTPPLLRITSKALIDSADQGLYTAKRNGRDRIELGSELVAPAMTVVA